jgi:transcriptional regulator with XRE-family HTH domain
MTTNFAGALKEKQRERGETQTQFAKFLGIHQSTLSRIYSNRVGPGGSVLRRILARYPGLVSFFAEEYTSKN